MISGRVVVTGHDAAGAARVLDDRTVAATELAGPQVVSRLFAGRDGIARFPETDEALPGRDQPDPGGWRCATLTIAAGADDAYHGFVAAALRERADQTEPGFHKTPTVDAILMVSGQLSLELDGDTRTLNAGDVAILNGVRHRWRNPGAEDATLFCVMIGAHHGAPSPAAPSQE